MQNYENNFKRMEYQMRIKKMETKNNFKLKSEMDISSLSTDYMHTASLSAHRFPFYLENGGHFFANMGYFTEREGFRSYLFMLTIKGCGYIRSKNKEILLSRNHAVLIDCMDYQYYQTASDSSWEFVWVHINGTSAALYYDLQNQGSFESIDFGEDKKPIELMMEIFKIVEEKKTNIDLLLSERLITLCTKMLLAKNKSFEAPHFEQHRKDITYTLSVISERYSEPLTIDELSKHAHISKYYFVRVFKDFTGQTPYEYLMSYRINESKTFLLKTDDSVSMISSRCGFVDTSNFIRCFKRATGTTPKVFRKDRGFIV